MSDEEKYTEREFSEKFEELRWNLLNAYRPTLESPPQAFLLGGQSGAGKTTLHKIIHRRLDGNGISINGDDYRKFHPRFLELQRIYGDEAVNYTAPWAGRMTEALIDSLSRIGYNLVIESTLRTAEVPLKTAELLRQRNLYHQLNQEAHTAMEACGGTAQGQSAMAKFNTKMGISMKTLTDKSTRNLAEMLTQGSGMGVVDCVKAQKDYPNAAPGTKRLAQRLMEFEEDNRVRLEQFL